jgi:hypothetical protein
VEVVTIGKFKFILPNEKIESVLSSEFSFSITKDFKECNLNKKKFRDLILEDAIDNDTNLIGDLIFGTDETGVRKIRLSKASGKGKREGYRVIVLVVMVNRKAYVIHVYDKKKKADLTPDDRENLKRVLKSFRL